MSIHWNRSWTCRFISMDAHCLWERKGGEYTKVLITMYQILMHLFRQIYYSDQRAWSPNISTTCTSCLWQKPIPLVWANKIQTESLTCPRLERKSAAQRLLQLAAQLASQRMGKMHDEAPCLIKLGKQLNVSSLNMWKARCWLQLASTLHTWDFTLTPPFTHRYFTLTATRELI